MVTICRSLGHIMYPLIFRFNSFYFRVFSLIISLDISPMDMLDHFCQYFISVICIIMLTWWIFSIYLFKYSWFPRCYFCCTVNNFTEQKMYSFHRSVPFTVHFRSLNCIFPFRCWENVFFPSGSTCDPSKEKKDKSTQHPVTLSTMWLPHSV